MDSPKTFVNELQDSLVSYSIPSGLSKSSSHSSPYAGYQTSNFMYQFVRCSPPVDTTTLHPSLRYHHTDQDYKCLIFRPENCANIRDKWGCSQLANHILHLAYDPFAEKRSARGSKCNSTLSSPIIPHEGQSLTSYSNRSSSNIPKVSNIYKLLNHEGNGVKNMIISPPYTGVTVKEITNVYPIRVHYHPYLSDSRDIYHPHSVLQGQCYPEYYRSYSYSYKSPYPNLTSLKNHVCQHPGCFMRFKRLEHLKRHCRVHTLERPYSCTYKGCRKTFSRRDNLGQHLKTHERRIQRQEQFP